MNIVFFGTQNFCLPILEELNRHYSITAVITTPDARVGRKQIMQESPVALLAKDLTLPLFKPQILKGNALLRLELQNARPDLFVVVAYGKILPSELIEFPKFKTLNVHPSLLPQYRGPAPVQFALLNGDHKTGSSIMLMAPQVDAGPILAQESLLIDPDDTYVTLSDKLARLSVRLIAPTIDAYMQGSVQMVRQESNKVTLTRQITREDGIIDWNKTASQIYNQFRAFYPWPGIWTMWNGQILKIMDCIVSANDIITEAPGTVLDDGKIICGSGTILQIRTLQLAGKKETDIKNFLNGYKNFVHSRLN